MNSCLRTLRTFSTHVFCIHIPNTDTEDDPSPARYDRLQSCRDFICLSARCIFDRPWIENRRDIAILLSSLGAGAPFAIAMNLFLNEHWSHLDQDWALTFMIVWMTATTWALVTTVILATQITLIYKYNNYWATKNALELTNVFDEV